MTVQHPFKPCFNKNSKILILGTIPSPKSREDGFYYGHPANRFWKVLSGLLDAETPKTADEKQTFALSHGIALFDVLASCEIIGASDQSIKNPVPNDIYSVISASDIKAVFLAGQKAAALYKKHITLPAPLPEIALPSTSPANALYSLERLLDEWRVICHYLRLP